MSDTDDLPEGTWIRRDFLRDTLQPALEADGLTYLHCPDWSCGHSTVLPIGQRWVCPEHGGAGVTP